MADPYEIGIFSAADEAAAMSMATRACEVRLRGSKTVLIVAREERGADTRRLLLSAGAAAFHEES